MPRILRGRIAPEPKSHPYKAQCAYYHESHLPAPQPCKQRDAERSRQRSNRSTAIEKRSGKRTVFFRKIQRSHFDGRRKVAGLSQCEKRTAAEKKPHAHRSQGQSQGASALYGRKGFKRLHTFHFHRHPTATGMHTGRKRPYEYGPQIAAPGSHPIYELAGKKTHSGIEQREEPRYSAVVGIGPMKFGSDEVFPREREHLPVEVVYCSCKKQQRTYHPAPITASERR